MHRGRVSEKQCGAKRAVSGATLVHNHLVRSGAQTSTVPPSKEACFEALFVSRNAVRRVIAPRLVKLSGASFRNSCCNSHGVIQAHRRVPGRLFSGHAHALRDPPALPRRDGQSWIIRLHLSRVVKHHVPHVTCTDPPGSPSVRRAIITVPRTSGHAPCAA